LTRNWSKELSCLPLRQQDRYARHLILEGVGEQGQERLLAGSVLVIGAGGLGSPALFYLAAAGVGRIGIADSDSVELSNLQRQIIHTTRGWDVKGCVRPGGAGSVES